MGKAMMNNVKGQLIHTNHNNCGCGMVECPTDWRASNIEEDKAMNQYLQNKYNKGQELYRIVLDADEIEKLNHVAKVLNKTTDEVVEMFVKADLLEIEICEPRP